MEIYKKGSNSQLPTTHFPPNTKRSDKNKKENCKNGGLWPMQAEYKKTRND